LAGYSRNSWEPWADTAGRDRVLCCMTGSPSLPFPVTESGLLPMAWMVGEPWLLPWLAAGIIPLLIAWWRRRQVPSHPYAPLELVRRAAASHRATALPPVTLPVVIRMVILVTAVLAAVRPLAPGAIARHASWLTFLNDSHPGHVWMARSSGPQGRAVAAALEAIAMDHDREAPARVTRGDLSSMLDAVLAADIVILCDGVVPGAEDQQRLWKRVANGCGVVILIGPQTLTATDWSGFRAGIEQQTGIRVDDEASCGGARFVIDQRILPAAQEPSAESARAGSTAGRPRRNVPQAGTPAWLLPHPSLADPSTMSSSPLLPEGRVLPGPAIDRAAWLRTPEEAADVRLLAWTEPDHRPLALTAAVGQGRVVVSALPLDLPDATTPERPAWSDMAAWPMFLPYCESLLGVAGMTSPEQQAAEGGWWSWMPVALLLCVTAIALAADWALAAAHCGATRHAAVGRPAAAVLLVAMLAIWSRPLPGNPANPPLKTGADPSPTVRLTASIPAVCWPEERVAVPLVVEFLHAPETAPQAILEGLGGTQFAIERLRPAEPVTGGPDRRFVATLHWEIGARSPGPVDLRVRLLPSEDRPADSRDNSCMLSTLIAARPARLLVVDAAPRFEYRFLKQAIEGDRRFHVDFRLLRPDASTGAIDWRAYDAIWLGDVLGMSVEGPPGVTPDTSTEQPTAGRKGLVDRQPASPLSLDGPSLAALGDAVTISGIGLAWAPGDRFRHGGFALGGSEAWLPVTALRPLGPAVTAGAGWTLVGRPAAVDTGWLASVESVGSVYDLLEPVRLSPLAVVLMAAVRSSTAFPEPALVLGRAGEGTVLATLCETWRWRSDRLPDGTSRHESFWRQTLSRLAAAHIAATQRPIGGTSLTAPAEFPTVEPVPPFPNEGRGQRLHRGHARLWQLLLDSLLLSAFVGAVTLAWVSDRTDTTQTRRTAPPRGGDA
jgi:hypothetical protein